MKTRFTVAILTFCCCCYSQSGIVKENEEVDSKTNAVYQKTDFMQKTKVEEITQKKQIPVDQKSDITYYLGLIMPGKFEILIKDIV